MMITLRRAEERSHVRHRSREAWLTFYPDDRTASLANGFGSLEIFNEDRLAPGAGVVLHAHHDAEIVTYVREGSLAQDDAMGRSSVLHAGEFQRMTAGRGVRHGETNPSRSAWAHVFHIWVRPSEEGLALSHEQRRFCAADRRGGLCVVASRDGRKESLHLHQDVLVYSAMLDPGQHVVHELSPTRSAWLHVVRGEATLGDVVLTTGDGVGIAADRAVSLTARAETEVLLLDLGEPLPGSPRREG
jgi:redox-sensitive bicupin YhaK (pirin superfamily)